MPPPEVVPSYDLLDEPWIPHTTAAGDVTAGGIRDVLLRAHQIREIADPSPVVTAALHRLLLAVVHAAYRGPVDTGAWAALRDAGHFSPEVLDAYLLPLRDRFDLFHPEHPFYQDATLDRQYAAVISRLALELASGNNATLFDHTIDTDAPAISPADAARLLVAQHAFALGGRITFETGQGKHGSAKAGLLVKTAVILVTGSSLFDTLLHNLHQYAPREDIPCASTGTGDRPTWERDDPPRPVDRSPFGYLDFLTWQSRRVRLIPEQAPGGAVRVRQVVLMKGEQLRDDWHRNNAETMVAFISNPKAKGSEDPWPAVTFREDRALWRDSLSLVTLDPASKHRPRTLTWLDQLAGDGVLAPEDVLNVDAYGTVSDQAKMLMWRHERLALPLAYLNKDNADLLGRLADAITQAENAAGALRTAIWRLATILVAPAAADPSARQPAQAAVRPVADQFTALRAFWPRLDLPFRAFLLALPVDTGIEDGETTYGRQELPRWRETLRDAARAALQEATLGLDTSARTLRALAAAEAVLGSGLRKALGPAPARQAPIPQEVA